ncbi:MAG: hypothetical protein ACI4JM_10580 [Oscillospiraceae bacterium]
MFASVISLVLISAAFFIISAIIFQPSCSTPNNAYLFVPVRKANINSIENDVRAVMSDVNRNYKRTVKRVYLVNIDEDMGVMEICGMLCRDYDILGICGVSDIPKIME